MRATWSTRAATTLMCSLGAVVAIAVAAVDAASSEPATPAARTAQGGDGHRRTIGEGQIRFDGAGPELWAARARRNRLEADALRAEVKSLRNSLRRERRVLLSRPNVVEALNLACATYGHCTTLWRKARCETGGSFDPRSRNRSSGAAGLLQFLPSTWETTPYGRFSIWSPYANALAAGWMHAQGRGSEWACK
jgi:hypothetical protein